MIEQSTFWMVLGSGVPVFKHSSYDAAQREAARLARENPPQEFYVLQSVAVAVKTDVIVRRYDGLTEHLDDGIPF